MKCWLHRKDAPVMEFEWENIHKCYMHVSKYGTYYYIDSRELPEMIWITSRGIDYSKRLRATRIEFNNGAEFIFSDKDGRTRNAR